MGLLASSGVETAKTARDPLATRRPKPNFAKRPATRERRQFLPARVGFVRPLHRSKLLTLLGNASVAESRWSAQHPVPQECSLRPGAPLRAKPVPCAIARSGLVRFDRSERLLRVHLLIQSPFGIELRRCRTQETLPSTQLPSSHDPGLGLTQHPRTCPPDPSRFRVHTLTIEDRALDNRNGRGHELEPRPLSHVRVALPQRDCLSRKASV